MSLLIGEYQLNADAKGRILLPSAFRKQLPEGQGYRFIVNRGFENCLSLYTLEAWEKISRDLERLNPANPKAREYKRLFLNGATIVEVDTAGRINLPNTLLQYAGISKEIVFSAQGDKVELWDANAYHKYINDRMQGFSDLASEVAGGDFFKPLD